MIFPVVIGDSKRLFDEHACLELGNVKTGGQDARACPRRRRARCLPRFSEHNFGRGQDEAADRLMRALPGVPRLGLRLTTGPVLLAHRVTGYVPRAFRYPFEGDVPPQYEASARIWFFDAAVDRYLPDVAQFVTEEFGEFG